LISDNFFRHYDGFAPTASAPDTHADVVPVASPELRQRGKSETSRSTPGGRINAYLSFFILSDFVTIALAGIIAKFLYLDVILRTEESDVNYILLSLPLGILCCLCFESMGMYRPKILHEPLIGVGKLWGGLGLVFLVLLGMLYVFKISEIFSRGWILSWFALSAGTLVLARWQARKFFRSRIKTGKLRHSVAVYGTPHFVESFCKEYSDNPHLGEISGVFIAERDAVNSGKGLRELCGAVESHLYDTVVIAIPADEKEAIQTAIKSLISYSTELMLCSNLEQYPFPVSGSQSFGNLRMDIIHVAPGSETGRIAKACLDYLLAGFGVVAFAPVFLLIAIAIKLDSRGPVFFRQRRYGQNNKIFRIFKFRTMTVTEDGAVVVQATKNDARVTRVGRFLRRSSLDEIPQLLNVLLGDMSMVGPRPHAIAHDDDFAARLDLFSRRRRVKPGLTGWAQVNGFRGETKTLESIQGRMQHDLYYIDNWSIWLDLEIVGRTILVAGTKAY
jgi:Undecaprenyl-phosphate glucose phosphotransferase